MHFFSLARLTSFIQIVIIIIFAEQVCFLVYMYKYITHYLLGIKVNVKKLKIRKMHAKLT